MIICILKSKIHRATVTNAEIDYMGSISIDKKLMDHAKIYPYEKVLVVSLDSGERLETYVIEGKESSGEICINGAAARKILRGEKIIILSFTQVEEEKAAGHLPKIVYVNDKNEITNVESHVGKDDQC